MLPVSLFFFALCTLEYKIRRKTEKLATKGTKYEEKQRNWQHRVHNTKKNRETGNIEYTIRRKTEKLAT
jgi:hypothetical protein